MNLSECKVVQINRTLPRHFVDKGIGLAESGKLTTEVKVASMLSAHGNRLIPAVFLSAVRYFINEEGPL